MKFIAIPLTKSLKKRTIQVLVLNLFLVTTGKSDRIISASNCVSRLKSITAQGAGSISPRNKTAMSSAILSIIELSVMNTPESVAGLIEIILDPDFIEFDRKYARTNNGLYHKMEVNDPRVGLMVLAVRALLKQPLVEEAAIPSISIDGSKEYRLENVYAKDLDRMVADCSAWCLLVQEGRATFQIKGNPIRYDRFGEEATSSYFRKRLRNPRNTQLNKETTDHELPASKPSIWIYTFIGAIIAIGSIMLKKREWRAP